jgi:ribosomal protein L16 Arg81 hydroxylase
MLNNVLSPVTQEDFLRNYWTREFLHIPGRPDKFSHLFSWEILNKALEESRFDSKRLVLYRSGKRIATHRYLNERWVNDSRLAAELSNGATLIFNRCEEVHRPLRDLCVYLERLFHHRVTVNLYAGWRRDHGFNVHWDRQDTMILQVAGRKRWKVWNPTRAYPFQDDVLDTSTPPVEEPVWDETLEPGGMLSIPRGWWHVAYPLDEACLHLTVTIQNLNGIDLLHWVAERMKTSDAARMELPVVSPPLEQKEWLERVRADLLAIWDETLIDQYVADVDAKEIPRPHINLPGDADPQRNRLKKTTLLELAGPRDLQFSTQNGTVSCHANGMSWHMDPDVAEKIREFNDRKPHTIRELAPAPDVRITGLVGVMVMQGVLRRALDFPAGHPKT